METLKKYKVLLLIIVLVLSYVLIKKSHLGANELHNDFVKEDKYYFVYFYGDWCTNCVKIKDEINSYDGEIPLYKVSMPQLFQESLQYQKDMWKNSEINGTPTLYLVKKTDNGDIIIDKAVGYDKVPALLNKYEKINVIERFFL